MIKKLLIFTLAGVLILGLCLIYYSNEFSDNWKEPIFKKNDEINFLIKAGFPNQITEQIPSAQRNLIYQQCHNKTISYVDFKKQSFKFDSNSNPILVNDDADYDISFYVAIVTDFSNQATGKNYKIFPAFEFNAARKIENDKFKFKLTEGISVLPQKENFFYIFKDASNKIFKSLKIPTTYATQSGYEYTAFSNIPFKRGIYSGFAYCDIVIETPQTSYGISIEYESKKNIIASTYFKLL